MSKKNKSFNTGFLNNIAQKASTINNADKDLDILKKQKQELRNEIDNLKIQVDEMIKEINSLKETNKNLREELLSSKEINENLKEELLNSKEIIKNIENKKVPLEPYNIPDDIPMASDEIKMTVLLPRILRDTLKFQGQISRRDMKKELVEILKQSIAKEHFKVFENSYKNMQK